MKLRCTSILLKLALLAGGLWNAVATDPPAGSLDVTFNRFGSAVGTPKTGRAVALQPDGKIVVLGGQGATSIGVERFRGDGDIDTSFGGGLVTDTFNGNEVQEARAVAVQPDGKIVAVGWARQTLIDGSVVGLGCARFNADGTLDGSFGSGGKLFLRPDSRNTYGYAVALRPDGRIVVGGKIDRAAGTGFDFFVLQLNANGTLDGSFAGGAAWLATDFSSSDDEVTALALMRDGRIVATGTAYTVGTYNFAAALYSANGALEGVASYDFPSGRADRANAVALAADGRLVLAGSADVNNFTRDFAVARLLPGLALDPGFGSGGKLLLPFPALFSVSPASINDAYGVAVQSDGKVVLTGHTTCCGVALTRLNPDGSTDTSFGTSGLTTFSELATNTDTPRALVLDGDGRMVLTGDSAIGAFTARFLGGRYPFHGMPAAIPGRLEAEDYDNGGPEVAYHDASPSLNEASGSDQSGYRPGSGVDLERDADDGSKVHLAYVQAGEWTEYTVQSSAPIESWKLRARVASSLLGGTFRLLVDRIDVSGPVQIPNTGGWLAFQTVEVPGRYSIPAGEHILRVEFVTAGANGTYAGNMNWFEITPDLPCTNHLTSGLVGWWRGEGSAADLSGAGHSGTLANGVAFAPGLAGQAFSFDGVDDYVQIPTSPSLNPSNALTLEAWIKTSGSPAYARVISKFNDVGMGGANEGYGLGLHSDGTMRADIGNGNGGYYAIFNPLVVTDGQWHHIAAVFTKSFGALYVDGVPGPVATLSGIKTASAVPLLLGADPCCSGRTFQGLIDEAAVYDRALAASEILDLYAAGSGGRCAVTSPGPRNLPPVVLNPIPHQSVRPAQQFLYTIPANTFMDPDAGQTLSYQVANLPADFTFDPATRSFGGLPSAYGIFPITVIATDNGSPALSATNVFILDVVNANYVVVNTNDSGPGSLRQAILDANSVGGINAMTIAFDIQPPGPKTILPLSNLPTLTRAIVIDGTTQPGFDGQPIIELNGTKIVAPNLVGLDVGGNNCTIRGLVINNFHYGVQFRALSGHLEGCYLGTDLTGRFLRRNIVTSVALSGASNVIGGTNAAARNVISGSTWHGLVIYTGYNHVIQGNYIGTDATGTNAIGNAASGVCIFSVTGGGHNRIGGSQPGAGNVIAFNQSNGVYVQGGTNTTIQGNSIFSNGGLGISYRSDGLPTLNDLGDSSWPPNYPSLTSATMLPSGLAVDGVLKSRPSRNYRIDLYSNPERDPSGYGEGKTWLGFTNVVTDEFGNASFHVVYPPVQGEPFLSATATDSAGNTSEFGACLPANDLNIRLSMQTTRSASGPSSMRVTWIDPANAYTLESTASLVPPVVWQPVTTGIVRTPALNTFTVAAPAGPDVRFYRLRQ